MLADGFDIILDFEKSQGSWLVDQKNGDRYLDFFTMYASMGIGFNHPKMLAVKDRLGSLAIHKPSCSDFYSQPMAELVETFSRVGIPDYLPHLFFIEGGALAVENGLKTAFDWKVRKNIGKGIKKELGSKVIHFQEAFHGRSGYTLSLTNTYDPRKTKYFPKFSWPRISNPKITFPLTKDNLAEVNAAEEKALQQIMAAIEKEGDDIAALIIEPIQGEGGDNHFRQEFFQVLRSLCDQHDIMLIFDEVQTGIGITGKFWAHEHFDVQPDILSFGKKTQVCGILVGRRVDEVECNVFKEHSRISSTFGGNLIDMVRCTSILQIIEEENLVENARIQGDFLLSELKVLAADFPDVVSSPRGLGLMCAFDTPDSETRNQLLRAFLEKKLLMVGCGERSIRFRPHLVVTAEEIREGIDIIARVLSKGVYKGLKVYHDPCIGRGT
ncbi:MAG: L-lysine 6-transaminase [Proteobacteria bacterium]|nr:L-lysine 6-transaminase [Pseudomonadota bacterium]MBU1058994.1 L-lysine 6-transaminase [Pseudomonadota bacterium]